MHQPNVLLISCYELGHQPLGLASPLAFLTRAGIKAETIDLSVDPLDEAKLQRADFVAVSVPMHTALRLGLLVAKRVKKLNPACRLAFYGLYATLNAELLMDSGADAVLSGEYEDALVAWLTTRKRTTLKPPPFRKRLDYPVPERTPLPKLDRYVHIERADGTHAIVGTVEASRGCRHHCRHCPLPPVYDGRFFVVPPETVLADIQQLVDAGARHINFADPDFLNGPRHAFEIIRTMHRDHPALTFDFTAKVEHILKHRAKLEELSESGCTFIVSAVESLSDRVLEELDKGHTADDAREALTRTREVGIALRPTFVAFTPWTSFEDYHELFRWVVDEDLIHHVDPIQLTLRLLVPPRTLLLENPGLQPHLGELDRAALTYRWSHPNRDMDQLQIEATAVVASGARERLSNPDVFRSLAELVGVNVPHGAGTAKAPRLTEAWFC